MSPANPGADPPTDDSAALESADALEAFGAVYEITTDKTLTFEEKIDSLLSVGVSELGVPYGFLSRIAVEDLDGERGTQTIIDAKGDHELLQPGQSAPLSKAYCRKTIKSDDILTVHDAPAVGWEDDPAYETFDLGSYIGGKVELEDELYGTFCFASTDPREAEFTAIERTFVRVLSKWASYELEQNRTQERLKRKNEQLQNFANVVSHDLRNPLNVAEGRLELAREEHDSEHLAAVESAHTRMKDLIEDLLTLAREGASTAEFDSVSLPEIVQESWENVATGDITLVVETDQSIWAAHSRLVQLFENLIRNAVEHGPETTGDTGGPQGNVETITVGTFENGFYLSDDGQGIPEELQSEVVEPGYTSATDGTGLGLSIVSEIAAAHEWDFTVTNGKAGGARIEFGGVDFATE
jgi:signal transduction histidine kinase